MTKDEYKDKEAWLKKGIENVKKALKTTEENYAIDVKKIKARVDEVSKDLQDKIKEVVRITAQTDGAKVEIDILNTDKAALTSKNAVLDAQLGLKWKDYQTKSGILQKDIEGLDKKKREFLKIVAEKHAELDGKKSGIEYAEGKNKGVLVAITAQKGGIQALIKRNDEEKLDFAERQHQFDIKVGEHNEKMQKENSIISKMDAWDKNLTKREEADKKRLEVLDKKGKDAVVLAEIQKDKGIEQDLRDSELDKKERRINNLIAMNKIKE